MGFLSKLFKNKSAKRAPLPDLMGLADKGMMTNRANILDQTRANRANQTNQFGSVNWSMDPTSGQWTQTEKYNPQQQALLDQQIATQGLMGRRANELMGSGDFGYANAPAMPEVGGYDQRVIDTMRALQAPQLEQARSNKEAQLAAMGLGTGSGQAWNTEQMNIGDRESRADMGAILAGIEEGNTDFGQGMALRNTYTGEQDRILQNAGGMMGGAAPEDLKFGSYAQQGLVDTPNYAGLGQQGFENVQGQNNAKAAAENNKYAPIRSLINTGIGAAASYYGAKKPGT